MKTVITRAGLAAIAALALCIAAAAQAPAPHTGPSAQKHDSNTLHKIGKAIQYPFQKAGNNLSVDVHRAEGKNSVVRRNNGPVARNEEVKPNGHIVRAHRMYAHHRHHSKWWWRHHHHM